MAASQPRRSRDELRELLLEAGGLILRERGIDALTFKNAFDRLEQATGIRLTNASVIRRVWESQAEFRVDVLVAVALDENEIEVDRTVEVVGPVLADIDLSTPESRESAMRELCRLGGAANLHAMRQSSNWPLWISLWGLTSADGPPDYREKIREALVSGYNAFNERIEEAYVAITSFLGYRLREGLTLRQFTIAANTLGQGCGLRDRVDSSNMDGIFRSTGPGGEKQEWTLFAIAFEGLVKQFFELVPDWAPKLDDA